MSGISFHRTAAIVLRQYYLMRGSPARVLPLFAWIAIDIVLWGFITRYLNSVASSGFDFVPVLLGAVLMWDFFTRVMHGVSMAFLEDVWSHNFLNLFSSPLSIREYLCGLVLSSVATTPSSLPRSRPSSWARSGFCQTAGSSSSRRTSVSRSALPA